MIVALSLSLGVVVVAVVVRGVLALAVVGRGLGPAVVGLGVDAVAVVEAADVVVEVVSCCSCCLCRFPASRSLFFRRLSRISPGTRALLPPSPPAAAAATPASSDPAAAADARWRPDGVWILRSGAVRDVVVGFRTLSERLVSGLLTNYWDIVPCNLYLLGYYLTWLLHGEPVWSKSVYPGI